MMTFFAYLQSHGQAPVQYSNPAVAKLYYNPAHFSDFDYQVTTIYRNEFPRFTHNTNFGYFEMEKNIKQWNLGFSANSLFFSDLQQYDLGFDVGYTLYPYEEAHERAQITIAAKPVFKFHSITNNPGTEYESRIGDSKLDLDFGVQARYNFLSLGFSRTNTLEPEFDYASLAVEKDYHANHLNGSVKFVPLEEIVLQIDALYSWHKSSTLEFNILNIHAVAGWNDKVQFGAGYKLGRAGANDIEFSKAIVLHLGFKSENFLLRYSYDIQQLPVYSQSGGAHEIGISFTGLPRLF